MVLTSSTVCLCAWIVLVITCYTLGVIQIVSICRFLTMQHLVIVKKRYPRIIIAEAIMSTISLLITEPLWSNLSLGVILPQHQGLQHLFQATILGVAPFVSHFIVIAEACRLWLIYYDLNYLDSSKDETWKSNIDSSFAKTDWFLQNRTKWGNKSFVTRCSCTLYIISAGFCSFMFVFADLAFAQLADGVFILVPICFILYIYSRCPKHANDRFWFHFELTASAITFAIGISFYFILIIPQALGYDLVNLIATSFLTVIVLSVPSLISIVIIPCKISAASIWLENKDVTSLSFSLIIKQHNAELNKSLVQTTENKRGFSDFVLFVSQEFCLEVILSLIEMIQFQVICEQNHCVLLLPFAPSAIIPQSSIVYGSLPRTIGAYSVMNHSADNITQLKARAYLLYQKYIERNSLFEVNISGTDRMELIAQMEDVHHWMEDVHCEPSDLYHLFAKVIEEQHALLLSSFCRYKEYIKHTIHE